MLDPQDIERLLRRLPRHRPPESLWGTIQAELRTPARPVPLIRRTVRSPFLAAAAVVLAVAIGTAAGLYRSFAAPSRWAVLPLDGAPTVAGTVLTQAADLAAGQWLVTDSASSARIAVGRIGTAEVGPESRVRLERGGILEHRLTLERGRLEAVIAAPPRLFFVETPSVLATDLGCAYVLEVDDDGSSRLHVTAGWVELREGHGVSIVPAGLVAEVRAGQRPGTPYRPDFPLEASEALQRLDAGTGTEADLDLVLDALHRPTDYVTLRKLSGITLWHLLQRVEQAERGRVYRRLAALSPTPAGVTMEGILALDRPMLERWRRDLSPMWSEEAVPFPIRVVRRMWDAVMEQVRSEE